MILSSVRTSLFDFQGVLAGYYVWVASMVVMLIGATRAALRDVDARWALPIESKLE